MLLYIDTRVYEDKQPEATTLNHTTCAIVGSGVVRMHTKFFETLVAIGPRRGQAELGRRLVGRSPARAEPACIPAFLSACAQP